MHPASPDEPAVPVTELDPVPVSSPELDCAVVDPEPVEGPLEDPVEAGARVVPTGSSVFGAPVEDPAPGEDGELGPQPVIAHMAATEAAPLHKHLR